MRRATLSACISLLLSPALAGQVGSMRVTVPSPTAASLGKFGDIPVSLYTGVPQIGITLFTAQGRELSLPISLEYHASGIRVEEIGGWVGIGWALEAGGTITRTVRGLADDGGNGYFGSGHTWYIGNHWSPNPPYSILEGIHFEQIDGEPDEFFYNFGGRSGQFVAGPISATPGSIVTRAIPHQKLRIERSSDFDIQTWTITTEDGTKYVFGGVDGVERHFDYSLFSEPFIPPHYGQSYASSWHLTEIRSPGGDVITLQYAPFSARHRVGRYQEKFNFVQTAGGGGPCRPDMSEVYNEYQIDGFKLSSITTAAHVIRFYTSLRTDALSPSGAQQEPKLDRITVESRDGGKILRQFRLTYGDPTGRLTLLSVAEEERNGVSSLPPYTFAYDPQPLPDLNSFAQDHWGYFNGASNGIYLVPRMSIFDIVLDGADREPNPSTMRAGALTRITYPTGGFNEFVYEPNDFGGIGPTFEMPIGPGPEQGLNVSSTAAGTGTETLIIGGTDPVIAEVISMQEPGDCEGQLNPPCPMTEIVRNGGPSVYASQSAYQVRFIELEPGTYTVNAYAAYPEVPNPNGSSSISIYWQTQSPQPRKVAGGLRVKEVRTGDALGNVQVEQYQYVLSSDPTRSSGVIPAEPRYAYTFATSNCSFASRSSASKMPLGGGPIVGYREVTVQHGSTGQFGRTTHRFRSVLDAADNEADSWPYLRGTTFEFMRGQETGATELNTAGQLQQRTSQVHTFSGSAQQVFRGLSMIVYMDQWSQGMTLVNPFEVISGWQFVSEDTTTLYNETGADSIKNVRSYTYGNVAHLQLTQMLETNSNGTQRITRLKYPADYPAQSGTVEANAIAAMQGAAHIHNAVIERWVLEKTGGVERVVQGEITTFKEYAVGQYRPYQRFVLSNPSPIQ